MESCSLAGKIGIVKKLLFYGANVSLQDNVSQYSIISSKPHIDEVNQRTLYLYVHM